MISKPLFRRTDCVTIRNNLEEGISRQIHNAEYIYCTTEMVAMGGQLASIELSDSGYILDMHAPSLVSNYLWADSMLVEGNRIAKYLKLW